MNLDQRAHEFAEIDFWNLIKLELEVALGPKFIRVA